MPRKKSEPKIVDDTGPCPRVPEWIRRQLYRHEHLRVKVAFLHDGETRLTGKIVRADADIASVLVDVPDVGGIWTPWEGVEPIPPPIPEKAPDWADDATKICPKCGEPRFLSSFEEYENCRPCRTPSYVRRKKGQGFDVSLSLNPFD